VRAGSNDEEVNERLRANGIEQDDPKHQIVIFQTLYEKKDGSIEPDYPRAKLAYTKPLNKRAV